MPDSVQVDAASSPRQNALNLESLPTEVLYMICAHMKSNSKDIRNMRLVNRQMGVIAARQLFRCVGRTFDLLDIFKLGVIGLSPYGHYVRRINMNDSSWVAPDAPYEYFDRSLVPLTTHCLGECLSLLNQLEMITLTTTYLGTDDDPEPHCKIFIEALEGAELRHLKELALDIDSNNNLAELVRAVEGSRIWWRTFSRQLRTFFITQYDEEAWFGVLMSEIEGRGHSRPPLRTGTELTKFVSEMDTLEEIFVTFRPAQKWPIGGETFRCLRSLWLTGAEPKANDLIALIEQNKSTLDEVKFQDVYLTSGWWDQVLTALLRHARIKIAYIDDSGYSIDADIRSKSFRRTDKRKRDPIHSYRWADWHALRDLAAVTQSHQSLDWYVGGDDPKYKKTLSRRRRIWKALPQQYPTLEDYHQLPELSRERNEDLKREKGSHGLNADLYVPEGTKAIRKGFGTRKEYKRMLRTASKDT